MNTAHEVAAFLKATNQQFHEYTGTPTEDWTVVQFWRGIVSLEEATARTWMNLDGLNRRVSELRDMDLTAHPQDQFEVLQLEVEAWADDDVDVALSAHTTKNDLFAVCVYLANQLPDPDRRDYFNRLFAEWVKRPGNEPTAQDVIDILCSGADSPEAVADAILERFQ